MGWLSLSLTARMLSTADTWCKTFWGYCTCCQCAAACIKCNCKAFVCAGALLLIVIALEGDPHNNARHKSLTDAAVATLKKLLPKEGKPPAVLRELTEALIRVQAIPCLCEQFMPGVPPWCHLAQRPDPQGTVSSVSHDVSQFWRTCT